jgi:hypothetical protein
MDTSPGELRRVLREHAGLDVVTVRAAGGESRRAFWVTDRGGTISVLKIMPDAPSEVVGQLHALDAVLDRLRDRDYPAPRLEAIGQVPGLVFWVQQRMPGRTLEQVGGAVARLLDLAGPQAAGAYLAHMVLRQVDWSLRYHPAAAGTRRHLRLARAVTADIGPW